MKRFGAWKDLPNQVRKRPEPADPIFPEQRTRPRYHFFEGRQDALMLWSFGNFEASLPVDRDSNFKTSVDTLQFEVASLGERVSFPW